MEMTQHKCKNCAGMLVEQPNGRWKCRNCGSEFDVETVEKQTKRLEEMFDEQMRERIYNLRRNLYDALHASNISSTEVYNACMALKQFLPDDFQANFYAVASGSNVKALTRAIREIDAEKQADDIEGVVQYLCRSLQNEFLLELKNLVERAWRKTDLEKFERYSTEIEAEATKVQAGVYETKLPREVFVAYSSKDMDKVSDLVEELESQGIKCFVAARNLRHGRGAVENYNAALEEAMDHCRVFVFVSSPNSRSFDCDALKLEIPYIQKKDIENAPAEYRNHYGAIPQQYKKPRVEYRVKDSRQKNVHDEYVDDFFGGYEHAYSPHEVASRVMKQLLGTVGGAGESGPQKKYCSSCGEENAPNARFCSKCGATSFVASIAEFIKQSKAAEEAAKEAAQKKIREAEREAERQRAAAQKAAEEAEAARRKAQSQTTTSSYQAPPSRPTYTGYSSPNQFSPFAIGLLCLVLGVFGVHRFAVGKKKTGVLYLLTGGLLGFGVIWDLISIVTGRFNDGNGLPVGSGKKRNAGCARFVLIAVALIIVIVIVAFIIDISNDPKEDVPTITIDPALTETFRVEEITMDESELPIDTEPIKPPLDLPGEPMEFPPFTPQEIDLRLIDVLSLAEEFGGNYYAYLDMNLTWEQAKALCEAMGGHLATLSSVAEHDFCADLYRDHSDYSHCFLGGTDADTEGIWTWVTDEPWSLQHWMAGSPDGGTWENAVGFAYDAFYQNEMEVGVLGGFVSNALVDLDANASYPFICEWEEERIPELKGKYGLVTSSGMIFNNAFYFDGSLYKLFAYDMSFVEALEYCQKVGGHLATITSEEENQLISAYLAAQGGNMALLGGTDEGADGRWRWCTGEPFSYAVWNDQEPDGGSYENYLAHTGRITGEWSDVEYISGFLCEWNNCQFDEENVQSPEDPVIGSVSSPFANAEDVYTTAIEKMNKGEYLAAVALYDVLGDYKRSLAYSTFCLNHSGLAYQSGGVNGGYIVTGYEGRETKLTIPTSVGNMSFTEIGEYAFSDRDTLIEIVIGGNIQKIGYAAFRWCDSLEKVTFPNRSIEFSGETFWNCVSLREIVLPEGTSVITDNMFGMCHALESVTIPGSVSTIYWNSFSDCPNLSTVYYQGTEDEWQMIDRDSGDGLDAIVQYVSQPMDSEAVL